jgi:hypothetical protein
MHSQVSNKKTCHHGTIDFQTLSSGGENMKPCSSIGFLACQGMIRSQIET